MESCSVTIRMKATEQYFPVVLLITLYNVFLTFVSVDEILGCDHLNESYWAVYDAFWCFGCTYQVFLTFVSVDEILWCDHSNDTYFVELLHSTSHFLGF